MYTTIIFDFFDVIHSDPLKRWLDQHGLAREGGIAEASMMVDKGHVDMAGFYKKLSQASGQDPADIAAVFGKTDLIDTGMVTLIDRLRINYKIGLLSNSAGSYIRPILEEHSIGYLFDEIVISGEVGMIKPHTEIFDFILGKMNVSAKEAVFVDDNTHNTDAAESVGIKGIVFRDAKTLEKDLGALGISG